MRQSHPIFQPLPKVGNRGFQVYNGRPLGQPVQRSGIAQLPKTHADVVELVDTPS